MNPYTHLLRLMGRLPLAAFIVLAPLVWLILTLVVSAVLLLVSGAIFGHGSESPSSAIWAAGTLLIAGTLGYQLVRARRLSVPKASSAEIAAFVGELSPVAAPAALKPAPSGAPRSALHGKRPDRRWVLALGLVGIAVICEAVNRTGLDGQARELVQQELREFDTSGKWHIDSVLLPDLTLLGSESLIRVGITDGEKSRIVDVNVFGRCLTGCTVSAPNRFYIGL
jgi:hypothetical protein